MSFASNFPKGMPAPLVVADIHRLINDPGVSQRMVEDMLRDDDAPRVQHFGLIGNSRLFDEATVRAALPAIRKWFADADQRRAERWRATARATEEARAMREAPSQAWADPKDDARRAARAPAGFVGGDAPPNRKTTSRTGTPKGFS